MHHSSGETVSAFGGLVGVGAHGNRLPGPVSGRGLGPGQFDRVDLHHDLSVEVLPYVQPQVVVGGTGEAIDTSVGASPVAVDGVLKGKVLGVGDPVDDGLGLYFQEGESPVSTFPHHFAAPFKKPGGFAASVEAGGQLLYHSAWLLDQGHGAVREISMVKAFMGELVNRVLYSCVQFHGGMGYMRESAIERMSRDARLHPIGGGATEVMLEEVAKKM